jgi:predicted DNA-binding transcriptional regulator AlpA
MYPSEPSDKKFLKLKEVAEILGCSPWTVKRNIGKSIPHPVQLSQKIKRWRANDIEALVTGRNNVSSDAN